MHNTLTPTNREHSEHAEDLEDLLDRVRLVRAVAPAERRRLREHLDRCPLCALQVRNAAARDEGEVVSATDAQLDRLAMHRVVQQLSPGWVQRSLSLPRRWVQLALAGLLLSGTALAAGWWSIRGDGGERAPATASESPVTVSPSGGVVDRVEAVPLATTGSPELASEPQSLARSESASPAALFERARALRLKGDYSGARATYRRLQSAHRDSREAHLSYLIVGRMLLEQGHAELGAHQFEQYLSRGGAASEQALEEALVGHATALARLGRWREEAADWRSLLARHPSSLYADRARARLEELRRNRDRR